MTNNSPIIGIIGGFGPDTSATFCVRLVKHAHDLDSTRCPSFAVDFVSVPPEIAGKAINGSREAGDILAKEISQSIQRLQRMGVRTVALPCNTMHLFADDFAVPAQLGFLHIVDSVIRDLQTNKIRRIGLLATQLTVISGLYANRCKAAGIDCIAPSDTIQEKLSKEIGRYVEKGSVSTGASAIFSSAFEEFRTHDVDMVVLGCTDLSDMLEQCGMRPPITCIDSMDVLARACARLSI